MKSVQPEWCAGLTMQQQSTLFLAGRGPDGVAKSHPCKEVQRAYRATVFVAARYGRLLRWGERGDTFMCLKAFSENEQWGAAVDAFFVNVDSLPHHFLMHLLHGAEILGWKHPDDRFKTRWMDFYLRGVTELHLYPETEDEMDARLADWGRTEWGTA